MEQYTLDSPFPYFGKKTRVAADVWARLGNPNHYIEPFAGSLAVLLARTTPAQLETVNDLDGFVANFWRAISREPDLVATWASYPINELDLHSRHKWLVDHAADLETKLRADPEYCDPQIAGWWAWGISAWLGSGYCVPTKSGILPQSIPQLSAPRGVHSQTFVGTAFDDREMLEHMKGKFRELGARLRRVRVACGDWSRVVSDGMMKINTPTAVFLDPPYVAPDRYGKLYRQGGDVAADVMRWAIEYGENRNYRIALCGFGVDYTMPSGWFPLYWKSSGNLNLTKASKEKQITNNREVIWFSPHCEKADQRDFFSFVDTGPDDDDESKPLIDILQDDEE